MKLSRFHCLCIFGIIIRFGVAEESQDTPRATKDDASNTNFFDIPKLAPPDLPVSISVDLPFNLFGAGVGVNTWGGTIHPVPGGSGQNNPGWNSGNSVNSGWSQNSVQSAVGPGPSVPSGWSVGISTQTGSGWTGGNAEQSGSSGWTSGNSAPSGWSGGNAASSGWTGGSLNTGTPLSSGWTGGSVNTGTPLSSGWTGGSLNPGTPLPSGWSSGGSVSIPAGWGSSSSPGWGWSQSSDPFPCFGPKPGQCVENADICTDARQCCQQQGYAVFCLNLGFQKFSQCCGNEGSPCLYDNGCCEAGHGVSCIDGWCKHGTADPNSKRSIKKKPPSPPNKKSKQEEKEEDSESKTNAQEPQPESGPSGENKVLS